MVRPAKGMVVDANYILVACNLLQVEGADYIQRQNDVMEGSVHEDGPETSCQPGHRQIV